MLQVEFRAFEGLESLNYAFDFFKKCMIEGWGLDVEDFQLEDNSPKR